MSLRAMLNRLRRRVDEPEPIYKAIGSADFYRLEALRFLDWAESSIEKFEDAMRRVDAAHDEAMATLRAAEYDRWRRYARPSEYDSGTTGGDDGA